jgi:hypothetical protein
VADIKAVDSNYLTNDIVNGVWSEGLGDLTDGVRMFYNCIALTTFSSDLSGLTYGDKMFTDCSNLTTFSSDLSSLTDGSYMFDGCTNLTTFSSDLSSLTDGSYMFTDCSNLTTFSSDLSSLTDGRSMFQYCKLDTASVQNIADTINEYNSTISIDIGNSEPNEQENEAFNKMVSKGWTVYVNGSEFNYSNSDSTSCCASCASCCATSCASLTTLDENGEETVTPIPYWAKPVPSDEEHAKYVDQEGNYYNILGAQFIYGDSLDTYGMFTSLEDAAAQMRLKKIGEEEIETA